MSKLSIVISTWNSIGHIERCIESILSLDIEGLETIIVDSNSSDGTREYLGSLSGSSKGRKLGLRVSLVNRRVKWSEANEIGLDLSTGDWICLSNPDIIFDSSFLLMLQRCRESNVLVAAPQLMNRDGSPQTPKKLVTPLLFLTAYSRTVAIFCKAANIRRPSYLAPYSWNGEDFVRVDNPIGSFFMVQRKILLRQGGRLWHKGYLNGVSDLDAFMNFKRQGVPVWLFPSCQLVHYTSYIARSGKSWVEYDQSYGLVLYFRYWKMTPIISSILLVLEGISATSLEVLFRLVRPSRKFFDPRLRAWQTGQRLVGIVNGWGFRIRSEERL